MCSYVTEESLPLVWGQDEVRWCRGTGHSRNWNLFLPLGLTKSFISFTARHKPQLCNMTVQVYFTEQLQLKSYQLMLISSPAQLPSFQHLPVPNIPPTPWKCKAFRWTELEKKKTALTLHTPNTLRKEASLKSKSMRYICSLEKTFQCRLSNKALHFNLNCSWQTCRCLVISPERTSDHRR